MTKVNHTKVTQAFGQVTPGYARAVAVPHFRVNHGSNEFVKGCRHVNGIEPFWSHTKHRLAQFHGVRRDKFALHLKETEFRFNHRHLDLYKTLLELLRNEPL